jgi:hypothetical protein
MTDKKTAQDRLTKNKDRESLKANSVEDDSGFIRPEVVQRLIGRYHDEVGTKRNIARSRKWFSQKATKMRSVRTARMFTGGYKLYNAPRIGYMNMWQYQAKHADTLPVWDQFPVGFPYDAWESKGTQYISALNLHYLPPQMRLKLFEGLLKLKSQKRFRPEVRLKMTASLVKSMAEHKLAEAARHTYIYSPKTFMSRSLVIPANDWEIVAFLPLARWKGGSATKAYSISKQRMK